MNILAARGHLWPADDFVLAAGIHEAITEPQLHRKERCSADGRGCFSGISCRFLAI
jgi:hypothetical protein